MSINEHHRLCRQDVDNQLGEVVEQVKRVHEALANERAAAEEAPYWRRYRNTALCGECWRKRYPGQEPARLKDAPGEDCIVCDERTTHGIYVRMRVEWR